MGIRKKRKQPPKRSTPSVVPATEVQPKRRGRPPKKAKTTKVKEEEEPIISDPVPSIPEEEKLKCSICLDTSRCKKMKVLPCCHDFHEKCINRWFEVDIKCPLCRTWYMESVDGMVS